MSNKSLEQFLGLAAAMPENMAMREVEMAIQNYRASKNKETSTKLMLACQILCSKLAINEEGLGKVLSETQELRNIHEKVKNAGSN